MSDDPSLGAKPRLRIVANSTRAASSQSELGLSGRDVDWSILMARAQSGDGESYRRLLDGITPYLRSLAARRCRTEQDTEDAVQDVLLSLHSIRATYDPDRPFTPWLVAIANRRIIDHMRRQIRRRSHEQPVAREYETFADPAAGGETRVEHRSLEAAVRGLPAGQQQAVRLLKLQELSLKEASSASGLSISALKVATHRALKSLRAALSKGNEL